MQHDRELLNRWRAGDEEAGEALFDRHNETVVRFLHRLVYVTQDIQDLAQDTFMACRDAKSEFLGTDDVFVAYLLGFAYNKFREYLRRQRRGSRLIDPHADSAEVAEVTAEELEVSDPSAFVEQNEERKLLLKALRRIPVDYQLLVHLSYWEELTNPQIGRILGIPTPTVASRLRLAKERLQRTLDEFEADRSLIESTRKTLQKWHEDIATRAKTMIQAIVEPKR